MAPPMDMTCMTARVPGGAAAAAGQDFLRGSSASKSSDDDEDDNSFLESLNPPPSLFLQGLSSKKFEESPKSSSVQASFQPTSLFLQSLTSKKSLETPVNSPVPASETGLASDTTTTTTTALPNYKTMEMTCLTTRVPLETGSNVVADCESLNSSGKDFLSKKENLSDVSCQMPVQIESESVDKSPKLSSAERSNVKLCVSEHSYQDHADDIPLMDMTCMTGRIGRNYFEKSSTDEKSLKVFQTTNSTFPSETEKDHHTDTTDSTNFKQDYLAMEMTCMTGKIGQKYLDQTCTTDQEMLLTSPERVYSPLPSSSTAEHIVLGEQLANLQQDGHTMDMTCMTGRLGQKYFLQTSVSDQEVSPHTVCPPLPTLSNSENDETNTKSESLKPDCLGMEMTCITRNDPEDFGESITLKHEMSSNDYRAVTSPIQAILVTEHCANSSGSITSKQDAVSVDTTAPDSENEHRSSQLSSESSVSPNVRNNPRSASPEIATKTENLNDFLSRESTSPTPEALPRIDQLVEMEVTSAVSDQEFQRLIAQSRESIRELHLSSAPQPLPEPEEEAAVASANVFSNRQPYMATESGTQIQHSVSDHSTSAGVQDSYCLLDEPESQRVKISRLEEGHSDVISDAVMISSQENHSSEPRFEADSDEPLETESPLNDVVKASGLTQQARKRPREESSMQVDPNSSASSISPAKREKQEDDSTIGQNIISHEEPRVFPEPMLSNKVASTSENVFTISPANLEPQKQDSSVGQNIHLHEESNLLLESLSSNKLDSTSDNTSTAKIGKTIEPVYETLFGKNNHSLREQSLQEPFSSSQMNWMSDNVLEEAKIEAPKVVSKLTVPVRTASVKSKVASQPVKKKSKSNVREISIFEYLLEKQEQVREIDDPHLHGRFALSEVNFSSGRIRIGFLNETLHLKIRLKKFVLIISTSTFKWKH